MSFPPGLTPGRYRYNNTRQYLRIWAAWPLRYQLESASAQVEPTPAPPEAIPAPPEAEPATERFATTKNVSAGGIALVVEEEVPIGSRLKAEFSVIPIARRIRAEGQVVRRVPIRGGGFEVGIRFLELDPEDRHALNETVQRLIPARRRARELDSWWRRIP